MTNRRVLLIAYHFPPLQGSSGIHRTLAFSRYLRDFGWQATVLTVSERAFEDAPAANLQMIPAHVDVIRAQAWDCARHFALGGRYPNFAARPDRWASWIPFGVIASLRELDRRHYDAIFSTFPIASAHVIARALHRHTRLPWLADFRDPMATSTYPTDPAIRRSWTRIQDSAFDLASRIIVTTPGAADFYCKTYPSADSSRLVVISNGFDPESLTGSDQPAPNEHASGPTILLHSGTIYPRERDPAPFFRALKALRASGKISTATLQVRLRASGSDDKFRRMIAEHGLGDIVLLAPSIPYLQALQEMNSVDALLIFQASVCNQQIPAKAYEYLFAGRPILALADPDGDTGQLMRRFGVPGIAALEDERQIAEMLAVQLPRIRAGHYPVAPREAVMALSRRSRAAELARQLDAVASNAAPSSPVTGSRMK